MPTRRTPPLPPIDTATLPGSQDPLEGAQQFLPPEDDEPVQEQTASDRVMQMLAGVAADERAKMTVHQVMPNGKESWCEDYTPQDYELGGMKMIRDKWGAGSFKVRLYGVRDGHFGILASATIAVKEAREPAAAPASPNNDALRVLAEGQQQLLSALAERPVVDPMADMARMFSMMKLMREAMGSDAPPPAPRSSVSELVQAIKELRGATELIQPRGGDDDSLLGMAKTFLPAIATMVGNQRAGAGAAAPLTAQPLPPIAADSFDAPDLALGSVVDTNRSPQPTDQPAGEPAEIPTGNTDMGITSEALTTFKLKAYLASLVMMARSKYPTDKGAELVYSKLPDEWIDMLDLPTWWPMFKQACPEAEPYEAWFTEVRDKAMRMFAEGDDETGDDASSSTSSSPKTPARSAA